MENNILQQRYIVEGDECSLNEIKDANSFDDNDQLFQKIATMGIDEIIGEGFNMATIKRVS